MSIPKAVPRFTVPQVDTLRVLATLGIFIHHLWGGRTGYGLVGEALASIAHAGQFGVVHFNVMTGFLLALPCLGYECRMAPEYVRFVKRRALRIVPPYYLAAILFTGLNLAVFGGLEVTAALSRLLQQILFLQGFDPSSLYSNTAAYWYLTLLAQFYLMYPLLLRLFLALGPTRACLLIGGLCWGGLAVLALPPLGLGPWLASVDSMVYFNLPARLPEFTVGMWLASAWKPGVSPSQGAPLDRAFAGFTLGIVTLGAILTLGFRDLPLPFALFQQVSWSVAVFVAIFIWPPVARVGASRWIRGLSAASYGVYLVHQPIFSYWGAWTEGWVGGASAASHQSWFMLSCLVLAPAAFALGRTMEPAAAWLLSLGRKPR
ncbi:MAG: acyltransferase [Syntrophobacteraceae bacterium]|nr:acyltransferase [Syntrophobacteraceae bacterium]